MRVAITGASGLIGSALAADLRREGHDVLRLVRGEPRAPDPDEVRWNPAAGYVDLDRLAGVDAVVHLAGAGIGDRPWTPGYRRTVRDSRVLGTRTIATAVAQLAPQPRVLVSASAMGYYGDGGDRVLDETAPVDAGFLAEVVQAWEAAADPARAAGLRVAHPRSSLVMAPKGGLLPKLLLPFRVGLGGRIGSGEQWWSAISLVDEVRAIRHLIDTDAIVGPVNLAAPSPARNAEWARLIGERLHRPARVPVPASALRLASRPLAGQLEELMLFSQRMEPTVLERTGFRFEHPDPESIISWALGS